MLERLDNYIKEFQRLISPSESIKKVIIYTNINRVFYLALLTIPIRVLTIITLLNKNLGDSDTELRWKTWILIFHLVYLIVFLIVGSFAFKLRQNDSPTSIVVVVQYIAIIVLLMFGGVVVAIDQLVTTNITPFLISCVAVGTIFIIPPLHSLLLFLLSYGVYYYSIGQAQLDPAILLSNRINGLTSISLGIILSYIIWRHNIINIMQQNRIKDQHAELEQKNIKLQYLADYDSLTGLINRRGFEEIVVVEIARINRDRGIASLLLLDIDNFKNINDEFGHPIGDEALKGFATSLKSQLRDTDIVARVGGEEFAVLLTNTNLVAGRMVAEKIRTKIENQKFKVKDNYIDLTVSIGITELNPGIISYEQIYKLADDGLYKAKAAGKNRVRG